MPNPLLRHEAELGPGITASLSIFHVKSENEGGAEAGATMGIAGLAFSY